MKISESEPTMNDLKFFVVNAKTGEYLAAVTKQETTQGETSAPEWTSLKSHRLESKSQNLMIRLASFTGPQARVESSPKIVLIA